MPTKREMALLTLASGDPVMEKLGNVLAAEDAPKIGKHLGQGFMQDPVTGEVTQQAEMQAWYREKAQRELEARMQLQRALYGIKNAATEAEAAEAAAEADRTVQAVADQPDAFNPLLDVPLDLMKTYDATRGVGNWLEEQVYSPEEMEARELAKAAAAEEIHEKYGGNLTGGETARAQGYLADVPGMSGQAVQRRLERQTGRTAQQRDIATEADMVQNGRAYKKVGGKWHVWNGREWQEVTD
jgi:hypothetical protein